MTLQFIKPVQITDANFVSSTAPETDYATWNGATTYSIGNRVIKTSTHRIYESVQNSNLNHDPAIDTNGTWWVDVGPTNRWAMFDKAVGSVTSQATPLTVVLTPGIVNSLALLDVEATSAHITMVDGATTVYDETIAMGDTAIILDWYMYFFEPIKRRTILILDDLPPYSSGQITVSITAPVTAKCGTLAVGSVVEVGRVRSGASLGIIDYSRKETDTYGVTSVVERAYAKKFDLSVLVEASRVDYLASALAEVRATAVVWVGSDLYNSLIAYGYYKDWGIDIAYPNHAEARITIEGLI